MRKVDLDLMMRRRRAAVCGSNSQATPKQMSISFTLSIKSSGRFSPRREERDGRVRKPLFEVAVAGSSRMLRMSEKRKKEGKNEKKG